MLKLKKNRIDWIDIAKFFGIFFIILGHVYIEDSAIRRILYTFHVPLFFILSGLTFRYKRPDRFILNKIRTLYIPYIVTSVISILVYLIMGSLIGQNVSLSIPDLTSNLFGMLYANVSVGNMIWNRPLWFIPALFVCLIITDLIEMIKKPGIKIILVVLLTTLGMTLSSLRIFLPLQSETALSMLIWVYIGIYTAPYLKTIKSTIKGSTLLLITLFLMIAGIILGWINGPIEVMIDYYSNNILFYFITAYSLSFSVILWSIIIGKNKILSYIGQNTLFLLLWSKFPILFFQEIVPGFDSLLLSTNVFVQTLAALFVSVITILLCLIGQKILWIISERIIPKNWIKRYREILN